MKPVRDYLEDLRSLDTSDSKFLQHCYSGLPPQQKDTLATHDVQIYTGKVRDMVYQGDEVQVVHSDRLSAFDRLIGLVPYKGTMLAAISEYWFTEAAKILPTHYKSRPGERVLTVQKHEPIKAEVIVRGYLAGSMMRAYEAGERMFCGVTLPNGLKPYAKLPEPIITPTTKAAAFDHDEDTTADELMARGIASTKEWIAITNMALKLFQHGSDVLSQHGWILVDTKYEFGRSPSGQIAVIDEIHTPDSSRFWLQDSYAAKTKLGDPPDMLDKEIVRRWLLDRGFKGHGDVPKTPAEVLVNLGLVYLDVAEKLIGNSVKTSGPNQVVKL